MREKTLSARASGGDRVSDEFLAITLQRRAAQLVDDPTTALFFGRLDLTREHGRALLHRAAARQRRAGRPGGHRLAAPITPTRSTGPPAAEPMGVRAAPPVRLRPRRLTAYEDEHLRRPAEAATSRAARSSPARSSGRGSARCATSSPPSSRSRTRSSAPTLAETVCVQGAPGTGKTAVGLHRAAYLLYAHRDRLLPRRRAGRRARTAPSSTTSATVLPALGEVDVRRPRSRSWSPRRHASRAASTRRRRGRPSRATRGWPTVLRPGGVVARSGPPTEPLVVPRGARRWRVPRTRSRRSSTELRGRGRPLRARRAAMLPAAAGAPRPARRWRRAGDSPDDRVQDAVARSRRGAAPTRRRAVAGARPAGWCCDLLSRPGRPGRAADGRPDRRRAGALLWPKPPRPRRRPVVARRRWCSSTRLADLLERTPSLGHVVLDEAQDLSPMQLRAVGRRCSTGSATVLGDIAQGTTPWATDSWAVVAGAPRQAGRPHRAARPWVPGAGDGDRVRRAGCCRRSRRGWVHRCRSARTGPPGPGPRPAAAVAAEVAVVVARLAGEPGSVGVIAPAALVTTVSTSLTRAGIGHGMLGADHGDVEPPGRRGPGHRGEGPRVRPGRGGRTHGHRRGRAGRANRAAAPVRRAHPSRLGADRRALEGPSGCPGRSSRPALTTRFGLTGPGLRRRLGPPGNPARTIRGAAGVRQTARDNPEAGFHVGKRNDRQHPRQPSPGGTRQHRRHHDRVVRLLPLRHRGGAGLPEAVLPRQLASSRILPSFAALFVGFAARPVGAAIFGHFGDRVGRKATLVTTLVLMGDRDVPHGPAAAAWHRSASPRRSCCPAADPAGHRRRRRVGRLRADVDGVGSQRRRGLMASFPQLGVPFGLLLSTGMVRLMPASPAPTTSTAGDGGSLPAQHRAGRHRPLRAAAGAGEPGLRRGQEARGGRHGSRSGGHQGAPAGDPHLGLRPDVRAGAVLHLHHVRADLRDDDPRARAASCSTTRSSPPPSASSASRSSATSPTGSAGG